MARSGEPATDCHFSTKVAIPAHGVAQCRGVSHPANAGSAAAAQPLSCRGAAGAAVPGPLRPSTETVTQAVQEHTHGGHSIEDRAQSHTPEAGSPPIGADAFGAAVRATRARDGAPTVHTGPAAAEPENVAGSPPIGADAFGAAVRATRARDGAPTVHAGPAAKDATCANTSRTAASPAAVVAPPAWGDRPVSAELPGVPPAETVGRNLPENRPSLHTTEARSVASAAGARLGGEPGAGQPRVGEADRQGAGDVAAEPENVAGLTSRISRLSRYRSDNAVCRRRAGGPRPAAGGRPALRAHVASGGGSGAAAGDHRPTPRPRSPVFGGPAGRAHCRLAPGLPRRNGRWQYKCRKSLSPKFGIQIPGKWTASIRVPIARPARARPGKARHANASHGWARRGTPRQGDGWARRCKPSSPPFQLGTSGSASRGRHHDWERPRAQGTLGQVL